MKLKWMVFAVVMTVMFLVISSSSKAVNQREIDGVLGKQVLDSQDMEVIDSFLDTSIQELVRTRDFTTIAQIRAVILSKKSGKGPEYTKHFSESARKHLTAGLQRAMALPEDRSTKVIVNLLILIDQLQDTTLTDISLGMAKNPNPLIRYWAIHSLTNPGFAARIKLAGDNAPRRIAEQLKTLVSTSNSETLVLMAKFAASFSDSVSEELLMLIADARIKSYADWSVKYELGDIVILKALAGKLATANLNREELGQRFGQLYSFAIQRYVRGSNHLDENSKLHLASLIIEIENKAIAPLLSPQATLKRAIETGNEMDILAEHDRLFGTNGKAGALGSRLNFTFGKDVRGRERLNPLPLPEPPAAETNS